MMTDGTINLHGNNYREGKFELQVDLLLSNIPFLYPSPMTKDCNNTVRYTGYL